MSVSSALPPFRKVNYVEPRVEVERRDDGSIILRNPHPMADPARNLIEPIRKWASERPDQPWLGQRAQPAGGGRFGAWRLLTYRQADVFVTAIAQALIERGLGQQHPVMIWSGNSIEHALMTYGAILAGAPVAPVSPAYSTMSSDFEKLIYVVKLIEPKVIFMQSAEPFRRALEAVGNAIDMSGIELVTVDGSAGTSFDALLNARPTDAVEKSYDALTHDTVAKYLFTSGSTGMPKAVITTHGMMCVNSAMPKKLIAEEEGAEPPTLLNWLPWNHCFGANSILNNLLTNGGTLYIDGGRPVPGQFDETIQNLREIAPTAYSNVPAGYALLVEALEKDEELARNFFSRLKTLAYGGAALSQDLYERMQNVAIRTVGERIVFSSGYGATETAPTIMNVHWETERMGLLGLPLPGVDIKLAPVGQKMEVRARGRCITPGYYKNPEKTAAAYDEEGFYCLGDGAKFVNPDNPVEGLVFDGRVVEDFKLSTGTWVSAGRLRVQAIEAAGGVLQDALVTGLDRPYIGILGFPNLAACRSAIGDQGGSMPVEEVIRHPAVLNRLAEGLKDHNANNPGSSTRIRRAALMAEPPSIDGGELTDKGYINQAAALSRRAALVERLYADPPGNDIVVV